MKSIQKQLCDQRVALYLDYIRHLDGRLALQNDVLERLHLSFYSLEHWDYEAGDQPTAQSPILAAVDEGLQLFRDTLRKVRYLDQSSVARLTGLRSTIEAASLWTELRAGVDEILTYDADAVSEQLATAYERLHIKLAAVNAEIARENNSDSGDMPNLQISTYDAAQSARSKFLGDDTNAAMTELAEAFPTLKDADGVTPWDPHALWAWAQSQKLDYPASAARFVLDVWDSDGPWGTFEMMPAFRVWDREHRSAALGFLADPWWP